MCGVLTLEVRLVVSGADFDVRTVHLKTNVRTVHLKTNEDGRRSELKVELLGGHDDRGWTDHAGMA
jgi:hypothetical protein